MTLVARRDRWLRREWGRTVKKLSHVTLRGLELAFERSLPVLFLAINVATLPWFLSTPLGSDAIVYARGAGAYLAGQDPWAANVVIHGAVFHFAGLPPTVLAFVPFAVLPEALTGAIWMAAGTAAAVTLVRRLRLPVWYVAFPPFVSGVWTGNPQLPLVALLVVGGGAVAPILKVFGIVPLIGERRWRSLAVCSLIFGATLVLAGGLWARFLADASTVTAHQLSETYGGLSAWGQPMPVLVVTCAALVVLAGMDWRTAGWLVVPAVWPGSQLSYGTMALPVVTPFIAAAMAYPLPGLPAAAVVAYTVAAAAHRVRESRSGERPVSAIVARPTTDN